MPPPRKTKTLQPLPDGRFRLHLDVILLEADAIDIMARILAAEDKANAPR